MISKQTKKAIRTLRTILAKEGIELREVVISDKAKRIWRGALLDNIRIVDVKDKYGK